MDIVFLRTTSRPNPRIVRMVRVADGLALKSLYLGAKRELELKDEEIINDIDVKRVGRYYPMLNGKRFITYLLGMLSFNIAALGQLRKFRPEIVHVSDIESFLAAIFYRILYGGKIIYNIHDNLAQRYPLPEVINAVLNFVEGVVVLMSSVCLVPEVFRADALPKFCRKRVVAIRNTPVDPGCFEPRSVAQDKLINIVYSGWIDSKRGVDTLLSAADQFENLIITVVGEGDPELIERFKSNDKCRFIGYVPYAKSIELLKEAHFVYIHYSPVRIINRFAAPNKLSESLAVGRPVVINSEIILSSLVGESKCGIVTPYGDVEKLVNELEKIISNEPEYMRLCQRSRKLFEKEYSWEKTKKDTEDVYKNLIKGTKSGK